MRHEPVQDREHCLDYRVVADHSGIDDLSVKPDDYRRSEVVDESNDRGDDVIHPGAEREHDEHQQAGIGDGGHRLHPHRTLEAAAEQGHEQPRLKPEQTDHDDHCDESPDHFAGRECESRDGLREDRDRRPRLQVVIDRGHADRERDQKSEEPDHTDQGAHELELEKAAHDGRVGLGRAGRTAAKRHVGGDELQSYSDGGDTEDADHEEHEQELSARELEQRVSSDRERPVHLFSTSVMNVGRLSRFCGKASLISSTKTSSRVFPSGTTSAIVPSLRTRPLPRIATVSQTSSTSLRRWLLSSTATPLAFSDSMSARTSRRPSGSSSAVGSSRIKSFGRPRIAWAMPRRCFIPLEYWRTWRRSLSRPAKASVSGIRLLRSTFSTPRTRPPETL